MPVSQTCHFAPLLKPQTVFYAKNVFSALKSDIWSYNVIETKLMTILAFLTPVSMQTTQSELPGPSTGVGADGVTGVPGVSGGLGIWMFEVLGKNGGGEGDGAEGVTSTSASCLVTLQGPVEEETDHVTFHMLNTENLTSLSH